MRKIRIYFPFINAGIQETMTYSVNWLFILLGSSLACLVSYFIWNAVYASSSEGSINGFTMPQMIIYIILMFLTSAIIGSDVAKKIGEEIRDGTIAMRMIKPVSYNATFLFHEIGNKLMATGLLFIPIIIVTELITTANSGGIHINVIRILLYLFSCTLANLISFFFDICFGFIAFAIKAIWGANLAKNVIISFLAGTYIPLSFFSAPFEQVLLFLPFASLKYTPVMIYMGMYQGLDLVYNLALQLFWVLAFWLLSKILWNIVSKHLSVQGG